LRKLSVLVLVVALVVAMVVPAYALESKFQGIKVGITFMTTNNPFFVAMLEAVKEEVEGKLGGTDSNRF